MVTTINRIIYSLFLIGAHSCTIVYAMERRVLDAAYPSTSVPHGTWVPAYCRSEGSPFVHARRVYESSSLMVPSAPQPSAPPLEAVEHKERFNKNNTGVSVSSQKLSWDMLPDSAKIRVLCWACISLHKDARMAFKQTIKQWAQMCVVNKRFQRLCQDQACMGDALRMLSRHPSHAVEAKKLMIFAACCKNIQEPIYSALIGAFEGLKNMSLAGDGALDFSVFKTYNVPTSLFIQSYLANAQKMGVSSLFDLAVYSKHLPMLTCLLRYGVTQQSKEWTGRALLLLAQHNDLQGIRCLLQEERDLDKNIQNEEGRTALYDAVQSNNLELAAELLQGGVDPDIGDKKYGYSPFMLAVMQGNSAIARLLWKQGARVNTQISKAEVYLKGIREGMTALIIAARAGDESLVRELIELGVDKNIADCDGNTALLHALQQKHVTTTCRLLEGNANHSLINNEGDNAVLVTVKNKLSELIPLLHSKKANFSYCDKNGNSPILLALQLGDKDMFNALTVCEASGTIENNEGVTPWSWIITHNKWPVDFKIDHLRKLLKDNADVASASTGKTPLMLAVSRGDKVIVDFLLSLRPNIDAVDNDGRTALMHLVLQNWGTGSTRTRYKALARLLIEGAANVSMKDKYGRTALDMALATNNKPAANMLQSGCVIM